MVDVDRRISGGGISRPSQAAGLRRLSTRASSTTAATTPRDGLLSFSPLASALLSTLRSAGVPIQPGLSPAEFARAESSLSFSFPPDLRAVLSLGLPSSPGFPDWRSPFLPSLLDLPIAAASIQIARHHFWPKSCGLRPADPEKALSIARSALRRAPLLIPLFDKCYIPSLPPLAGNPIFFVDEDRISVVAVDLLDFFKRESPFRSAPLPDRDGDLKMLRQRGSVASAATRRSLDSAASKAAPRWIEFWSDAAADRRRRRRNSSSSEPADPDPERMAEIRQGRALPAWVDRFLDRIGSVLKEGGWGEVEVREMMEVPAGEGLFEAAAVVDEQAVLDALLVKADRCSDSLRRAGWSSEEVADALGIVDFRRTERGRRPPVRLPAEIAVKIEKLAVAVSRC